MRSDFRCVPATRVKAWIENYIQANYPYDEQHENYRAFCHDAHIPERQLYAILHLERPNVTFKRMDGMLTRLDMVHVWRVDPENGGFADYYLPDIPPAPVPPNERQLRLLFDHNTQKLALRAGVPWRDFLHARALAENEKLDKTKRKREESKQKRKERDRVRQALWRAENPELYREKNRLAAKKHYEKKRAVEASLNRATNQEAAA